jgi:hypothetical protein
MGMGDPMANGGPGGMKPMPASPDPKAEAKNNEKEKKGENGGDRFGKASPKRENDKMAELYKDVWGHLPDRLHRRHLDQVLHQREPGGHGDDVRVRGDRRQRHPAALLRGLQGERHERRHPARGLRPRLAEEVVAVPRVKLLSGAQAGQAVEMGQAEAESATATGFAELCGEGAEVREDAPRDQPDEAAEPEAGVEDEEAPAAPAPDAGEEGERAAAPAKPKTTKKPKAAEVKGGE